MSRQRETSVAPAGSAILEALREPRYRVLWAAGLCANSARWMDLVVLGWLALELTDSPLMVGVAAFSRSAPMMGLGLVAGVLVDRVSRGRLMVLVQVINLAGALALALAFATDRGRYGVLVALALVQGTAWAIDFPTRRTVLFTLVGRERLTNAASLENVSVQGTKMLGPLVGGVLLGHVGPVGAYLTLALLHLVALALVRRVARGLAPVSSTDDASVGRSLIEGLREVREHPTILRVLMITVVMNTLVFPYQQMLPVFARRVLGVGPELLGLLVAAEGVGALIGSLTLASRRGFARHAQVFAAGSVAGAGLLLGFCASRWYGLSLTLLLVIGIAESAFGTMQSAIVLLGAPERARGRAMGILSACIGTQPLGILWIGFFSGHVGAPVATAIGATLALATMLPVALRMAAMRPVEP